MRRPGLLRRLFSKRQSAAPAINPESHRAAPSAALRTNAPPVLLLVGVDFGTAFTKVVWRDWGGVRVGVAAVGGKSGPIAESVVWIDDRGGLHLDDPGSATPERLLKMRLAARDPRDREPDEIAALCIFFVGEVLRRAQASVSKAFPGRAVEIAEAALGCPAAYCDDAHLAAFEQVAEQAWRWAHDTNAPRTMEAIGAWISTPADTVTKGLFDVRAEVAAAVDCFTMRPDAEAGRYLFLDVGGGTLDGACFTLYREQGATKVAVLSTDVKPFGVELLAREAAHRRGVDPAAARRELLAYAPGQEAWNPELSQVGGFVGELMVNAHRSDRSDWLAARYPTRPAAWRSLETVLSNARRLPVFFGGGGRDCPLYPTAASRADADLKKNYGIPPFALGEAAPPSDFEGAGEIGFHRFAVAYGLTREFDKAPEWTLPSREGSPPAPLPRLFGDRFGVDYLSNKDAYD
jgi:hypothetical protein